MALDASFTTPLIAALAASVGSMLIERMTVPKPNWTRDWWAWVLSGGTVLLGYGVLLAILGRPWVAALGVAASVLTLVLVNNAKVLALREPFVFPDYEYFTDAIRHPRLYIPFLGWWRFLAAVAGFVLVAVLALIGEAVPADRFTWAGQFGAIAVLATTGGLALVLATRRAGSGLLDPEDEMRTHGLLASLWRCALAGRVLPVVESPFVVLSRNRPPGGAGRALPHLVAVQSESFFDARTLHPGIRTDVLHRFDQTKAEAALHGTLCVPAWGANTVRTEFAFLSGIEPASLGAHRFNPYRAITSGWQMLSLASYLKRRGYRTVAVHPYPASFYCRNRVFPAFGFDEFIDLGGFRDAERFGPYVSDHAVAEKIAVLLRESTQPLFVFAITMENHGPLHLEKVAAGDISALYSAPPPSGCEDLTIYLRHLRNADRMIGDLRAVLAALPQQASLCWFGDHVPIMAKVYEALRAPAGTTEYFIWQEDNSGEPVRRDLDAHLLAADWLRTAGLIA